METEDYLDFKAIVILIILTLFWGFNHPAIKISNRGLWPIFASTLPSAVASICGLIDSLMEGLPLVSAGVFLVNWKRKSVSLT